MGRKEVRLRYEVKFTAGLQGYLHVLLSGDALLGSRVSTQSRHTDSGHPDTFSGLLLAASIGGRGQHECTPRVVEWSDRAFIATLSCLYEQ